MLPVIVMKPIVLINKDGHLIVFPEFIRGYEALGKRSVCAMHSPPRAVYPMRRREANRPRYVKLNWGCHQLSTACLAVSFVARAISPESVTVIR